MGLLGQRQAQNNMVVLTLTYMTKSHNAPLIFCMLYLAQLKQSLWWPTKQLEVMNDADRGGFRDVAFLLGSIIMETRKFYNIK